jgi:hypothetical protein
VGALRRLAHKPIWRPWKARSGQTGGMFTADSAGTVVPQRLAKLAAEMRRTSDLGSASSATYSFDLNIGEVADGYHLIVRNISLTDENLFFEYVFVPERTEEAEVWPNMNYGADVSPPGWNQACSDAEMYGRPVPEARHAWFDFFRPDYDWMGHFDPPGQPDSDYLRNRIARLTFDLKTGEAQIEK